MNINHPAKTERLPHNLLLALKSMQDKKYLDLYEVNGSHDLDEDMAKVVHEFASVANERKIVWLGSGLSLACIPTIERYLPLDTRPQQARKIIEKWAQHQEKNEAAWKEIKFDDVENHNYPQNLGEALCVLQYQSRLYADKSIGKMTNIILESVDLCLTGYAIAAGAEDRRPILLWIIDHLIPSAYQEKLPAEIYTIHTLACPALE